MTTTSLPSNTWVTMVHKKHHDRFVDYLYPRRRRLRNHQNTQETSSSSSDVTLLASPREKGSGQRHGYHILLTKRVEQPPSQTHLSPFGRQNMSWTARVQQQWEEASASGRELDEALPHLMQTIYQTTILPKMNPTQDKLRVDVYPRSRVTDVCRHLQRMATEQHDGTTLDNDDPFEGPLPMTASRSQCTLRLTVVLLEGKEEARGVDKQSSSSSSLSPLTCYWGLDQRPTDTVAMDLALNHEAHDEVRIVPMRPTDGTDDAPSSVPPTTPLCRAHYKLRQVWHDVLQPRRRGWVPGGIGIDVGASPGGWTQVLIHQMKLSRVYAMDPAIVAQRVLTTSGVVTHVPCLLDQWSTWLQKQPPQLNSTPLSISALVCDAGVLWHDLLQDMATHVLPTLQWQLPAVLVLTCKLPFVTAGSIARQVRDIYETVPVWIEEHVKRRCPGDAAAVHMEWQLLHLFANSESERTLVVILEDTDKDKETDSAPSTQSSPPSKKKAKGKKPKHLKRKIAQETDQSEKESLQRTLREFEQRKEELQSSKQQQSTKKQPKRQKVEPPKANGPIANPSPPSVVDSSTTNLAPSPPSVTSKNQADSDDDSSVDDVTASAQRQRGRRRRGRKDTSKKVEESTADTPDTTHVAMPSAATEQSSTGGTGDPPQGTQNKKPPRKDPSRYCIGRKPITDFSVGQTYHGTVKYVKPFGVFLDINCHSDAFCHVSWLRDDYVPDPSALYKEGDTVQARVVDIDREKKRITVSMQSEAMKEMEQRSLESRREHEEKTARPSVRPAAKASSRKITGKAPVTQAARPTHYVFSDEPDATVKNVERNHNVGVHSATTVAPKTHADLKRERKLARRAERRAKKEQEQAASVTQQ